MMTNKFMRKREKIKAQVKSRFYYWFWGATAVAVVGGQLYVGTSYRIMAKSMNRSNRGLTPTQLAHCGPLRRPTWPIADRYADLLGPLQVGGPRPLPNGRRTLWGIFPGIVRIYNKLGNYTHTWFSLVKLVDLGAAVCRRYGELLPHGSKVSGSNSVHSVTPHHAVHS